MDVMQLALFPHGRRGLGRAGRHRPTAKRPTPPSGGKALHARATVPTRLRHFRPAGLEGVSLEVYDAVRSAVSPDDTGRHSAQLQLSLWLDTFARDAAQYASPSVPCELILERARQCVPQDGARPHMLTTAVAIAVLFHFAPTLGVVAPLLRALVDEIVAVVFVRPQRFTTLPAATSTLCGETYYDAYFDTAASLVAQRQCMERQERMMAHRTSAIARSMERWRREHSRVLLLRWHHITQRHKHLRRKYASLFRRATGEKVVEKSLALWRQHAHRVQLALLGKTGLGGEGRLSNLLTAQQQIQERLQAAQRDASQRADELDLIQSAAARLRRTLDDARATATAKQQPYAALRRAWATSVVPLFNDSREVRTLQSPVLWAQELLEDSGYPSATAVAVQQSGRITAALLDDVMNALAQTSLNRRGSLVELTASATSLPQRQARKPKPTVTEFSVLDLSHRVCRLYRQITRGSDPPLLPTDITTGEQARLQHYLMHLMELHGGGHVSVFFANTISTGQAAPFVSRLRDEQWRGDVAPSHESGAMSADWRDGISRVERSGQRRQLTRLCDAAAAHALQNSGEAAFTAALEALHLSLFGIPGVAVRPHFLAAAAHPSVGVPPETFDAEWPPDDTTGQRYRPIRALGHIVRWLSQRVRLQSPVFIARVYHGLSSTTPLGLIFQLTLDDTKAVLLPLEAQLSRLWALCTNGAWKGFDGEGQQRDQFTRGAAGKMIEFVRPRTERLTASYGRLLQTYDPVAELVPLLQEPTMIVFLAVIAELATPDPYAAMAHKLRRLADDIFAKPIPVR